MTPFANGHLLAGLRKAALPRALKYYFSCPSCGNDEEFTRPKENTSNLGCVLLVLGGLIPFLLFAGHMRSRVQCAKCALIFLPPRIPSSPVASFAGWILTISLLSIIAAFLFSVFADSPGLLPSLPVVELAENAMMAKPRLTAYLVTFVAAFIAASCLVAALLSNLKYRRELSQQFLLKPPSARKAAQQGTSEPSMPIDGPSSD